MNSILTLGLAAAAAAPQPTDKESAPPSAAVQKVLQDCNAHKFETEVTGTLNGKPKKSKVKLCGVAGQSDADWLKTLKEAASKTAANDEMPPAIRQQIVDALISEIGRLSHPGTKAAEEEKQVATASPVVAPAPPPAVAAPVVQSTPLPPPRATTTPSSSIGRDYAALPPLPAAPVEVAPTVSPTSTLLLLPQPKLSFQCFTPGETGEGPCTEFSRGTYVTVKAGEDLPPGTGLSFVRNGETKADVKLAQLKRGKSMGFELPRDICAGIGGGELELKITRDAGAAGPQVVGREGPFNLRC